jgi:hypothetical protein
MLESHSSQDLCKTGLCYGEVHPLGCYRQIRVPVSHLPTAHGEVDLVLTTKHVAPEPLYYVISILTQDIKCMVCVFRELQEDGLRAVKPQPCRNTLRESRQSFSS